MGFSAPHRAAALIFIACFSQCVIAQVSDGKGLTPLEGLVPITDDRASELLAERRARGPVKRTTTKVIRKKTAAKKTAAKKTAAKKA